MKFLFLDTETTGTDVKTDKITQVCYLYKCNNYEDLDYSLFNPEKEISVEAMSVTHITNKMVRELAPFKDSVMFKKIQQYLDDGAILVAHNAKFDIGMLEKEGLKINNYICTLKNAYRKYPNAAKHNLQYLRYWLGLEIDAPAHDARGDVLTLKEVFYLMLDENSLDDAIQISKEPMLYDKFSFGKYKGVSILDVAKVDKDYLRWLLREKKKEGDEDWIFTLEKAIAS